MSHKSAPSSEERWQLYRLLAEPTRVRLLALVAETELTIGELSELLDELQPNVSRHVSALCQGRVLNERKVGTRNFVRLASDARSDVVVADAIVEGGRLCRAEGRLAHVARVLGARAAASAKKNDLVEKESLVTFATTLPAYVFALSKADAGRKLAVDVGSTDGAVLDLLAPSFQRVVEVASVPLSLERVQRHIVRRGYENVEIVRGSPEEPSVQSIVTDGACVVISSHVLRCAAVAQVVIGNLEALLRPGGTLLMFEQALEENTALGEQRTDVYSGISSEELHQMAKVCGLSAIEVQRISRRWVGETNDESSSWVLLSARRPFSFEGMRRECESD